MQDFVGTVTTMLSPGKQARSKGAAARKCRCVTMSVLVSISFGTVCNTNTNGVNHRHTCYQHLELSLGVFTQISRTNADSAL